MKSRIGMHGKSFGWLIPAFAAQFVPNVDTAWAWTAALVVLWAMLAGATWARFSPRDTDARLASIAKVALTTFAVYLVAKPLGLVGTLEYGLVLFWFVTIITALSWERASNALSSRSKPHVRESISSRVR